MILNSGCLPFEQIDKIIDIADVVDSFSARKSSRQYSEMTICYI